MYLTLCYPCLVGFEPSLLKNNVGCNNQHIKQMLSLSCMCLSVDDALMRDFIFCSRTSDTLSETKLGRPSKGSQGMR